MRRQLRFVRRFVLVCIFVGIAFLLTVLATMAYVVSHYDGTAQLPADCAIVFGAAVHSKDDPGPGIMRRVATAARLYNEDQVQLLFLTGGLGYADVQSEAEVMRRVALLKGIDPEAIVLETQATSTWENVLFTRPLTTGSCSTIIGISDRYHLARINYLAETQGWGSLQTYPADQVASRAFEVRSVTREALGLLYYFVMHRTLEKDSGEQIVHVK